MYRAYKGSSGYKRRYGYYGRKKKKRINCRILAAIALTVAVVFGTRGCMAEFIASTDCSERVREIEREALFEKNFDYEVSME